MVLREIEDFTTPVLQVIDALGGEARLKEIEDEFYRRFGMYLDPSKDWHEIKLNHGKELWRDYCGSRVAHHFLKKEGYIEIKLGGNRGSIYKLTTKGIAKLRAL